MRARARQMTAVRLTAASLGKKRKKKRKKKGKRKKKTKGEKRCTRDTCVLRMDVFVRAMSHVRENARVLDRLGTRGLEKMSGNPRYRIPSIEPLIIACPVLVS